MIVLLDLDKKVFDYKDTTPFIQGTDSRNVIKVGVPHDEVDEGFDIQVAYVLQNGRTTIKMPNSSMEEETTTYDDVVYNIVNFDLPKVATSLSGNLVATLIVKRTTGEIIKFNVLNNVLRSAEFEQLEEAFAGEEIPEALQDMESSISELQAQMANRVINGENGVPVNIETDSSIRLFVGSDYDAEVPNYTDGGQLYLTNPTATIGYKEGTNIHNRLYADEEEISLAFKTSNINQRIFTINGSVFEFIENRSTMLYMSFSEGINSAVPYYYNDKELSTKEYVGTYVLNYVETYVEPYVANYVAGNSVSLTGTDGTLTSEQAEILCSGKYKNPVINYNGGILNLAATDTNIRVFISNSHLVSGNNCQIQEYKIIIAYDNGAWGWELQTEEARLELINHKVSSWGTPNNNDYPTTKLVKDTIDNLDNDLQSQIDGINAGQNLADIVADLTALNNLDTSKLQANDKVQVLVDSNHNDASTVYNWTGSAWSYIGKYGQDSYTKSETDVLLNGKQDVIDSSNKLESDLVDDTNQTNKFVSASEKAQITTNQNAISGILDGTSIDSFADVETTLATKQDTLSGSTSIDITSNVVIVKDSYVESFFATDLEVQNMLSEVFN